MTRFIPVVATLALLGAGALHSQQPASPAAGKWEVRVDGQPVRMVELTVNGTAVKGTLTRRDSKATVEVAGEFKKFDLTFATPAKDESFGVMVREGFPVEGTYVYCTGGQCSKSGVTLHRPATK